MPQRTNEFQQLVALIQRSLAPVGARITESAVVTEDSREIDILIESPVGPYVMKIAVEAKDEGRKIDLVRFESIVGKYSGKSGILVNQVVVISRNGFTEKVVKRAARENVKLLTLQEATERDWAQNTPQSMVLNLAPHLAQFEYEPGWEIAPPIVLAQQGQLVCSCCGRKHGTPWSWGMKLLSDYKFYEQIRIEASRAGKLLCKRAKWSLGANMRLEWNEERHDIRAITAHFHCIQARGALEVKAYQQEEKIIHHLSGDMGGKHIEFVLPDGLESHRIALKIDDAASPVVPEPPPAICQPGSPSVSDGCLRLSRTIEESFQGIDASIQVQASVHNFATGKDVLFPLVAEVFYGGVRPCRAAVVFDRDDESESVSGWMRSQSALMHGCELDRLVAVTERVIADDERRLAETLGVELVPSDDLQGSKVVDTIAPSVQLILTRVMSANYQVYGCPKPSAIPQVFQITLPGNQQVTPQQLHQRITGALMAHALRKAASRRASLINEDIRIGFRLRFEAGTFIANIDRKRVDLTHLDGEGIIRFTWALLDQKAVVVKDGKPGLELCNRVAGEKLVIRTAELPRSETISILQHKLEQFAVNDAGETVNILLPGITGQQSPVDQNRPTSRSERVFKVTDNKDGPWTIQLVSAKNIRLGLMTALP